MIIHDDVKLDYSDVLLVPRFGGPPSRQEVDIHPELYATMVLPIIAANMDGVGTFEMALKLSKQCAMTALHKHYSLEDLKDFFTNVKTVSAYPYTMWSMGINEDDIAKLMQFKTDTDLDPAWICIDVANGYMPGIQEFVHDVKRLCPRSLLAGGNVVTPRGVIHWLDAGVDLVKVGIGPGSVCTTRTVTGVGYPQFSAVLECVAAAKNYQDLNPARAPVGIIADGGCTNTGDICKALAAGAKLVMLGGMLAGFDEGLPKWTPPPGYAGHPGMTGKVEFYGMASRTAQKEHGDLKEYRSSEGKTVEVPYRGPVEPMVRSIANSIRASASLCGVDDISLWNHKAQFVRVNNQINRVFGHE